MNRIERLRHYKKIARQKQRKERLRQSIAGPSRKSGKKGISSEGAKKIAEAISELLKS
ncbi:MAG: hypothetical protein ACQEQV_01370 [Fibrobacterota bacterium]